MGGRISKGRRRSKAQRLEEGRRIECIGSKNVDSYVIWSIPEDEHIIMLLCYVRKNVLCLSVARPPYSTEDWGADPLQWLGRLADWLTLPSFFSGILLIYLFIPWNSKTICYIQIMQAKATAAVTCDIHIIFRKKEEPPPAIKDLPSLLSTIRPFDPLKIRHFDPSTLWPSSTLRASSTHWPFDLLRPGTPSTC